jgi:Tfp pilus assembly protein FimT
MTKTSRGFTMIELVLGLSFIVLMIVAIIAMAAPENTSTIQATACNMEDADQASKEANQPCGKQQTTTKF